CRPLGGRRRSVRGILAAGMTRPGPGRRLTSRLVGVRVANRWTKPEPPLALVPRLRVPFAIVHGTDDRFIPVRDAVELHEAAPGPTPIDIVPGLGHAFEAPWSDAGRRSVSWVLERDAERRPALAAN